MIKSLDVAQIEIDELKIAIYARAIIKITRLAKDIATKQYYSECDVMHILYNRHAFKFYIVCRTKHNEDNF